MDFCRFDGRQRTAGGGAYDNASILDYIFFGESSRRRDGKHGEVERAAAAEFPIRALPSV